MDSTFLTGAQPALFFVVVLPLLLLGGPPQSHQTPDSCAPQEVQAESHWQVRWDKVQIVQAGGILLAGVVG